MLKISALLNPRYSSIGKSGQQEMAEKEDELLSSVLINLATFMNITGVGAERYKQLITNLVTYSRLGHRSDSITSTLEVSTTTTISPTYNNAFRKEQVGKTLN